MKNLSKVLSSLVLLSTFTANTQISISLQPNATDGKDAEIFSCVGCGFSTTNYGNHPDFNAMAWTYGGEDSHIRSLIEFDLTSIPQSAVVSQAFLSLYHSPTSVEGEHESLTGSNESVLRRVTSTWDENTVTWNTQPSTTSTNEVMLAESTSPTQNYLNIDVTSLVQDMIDNPSTSFGFQLKAVTEIPYRKLIFASSDHADTNLHPKLDITYDDVNSTSSHTNFKDLFKVYPNPTSNILNIDLNTSHVDSIEIINSVGQTLVKVNSPSQFESFDMSSFPDGVVFIRFYSQNAVLSRKVILIE